MPPRSNDDERKAEPRSWRERDRAKEGGGRGSSSAHSSTHRQASSQSYRAYKTQLNRMFDQGLPDAIAQGRAGAQAVLGSQRARRQAESALLDLPEGPKLMAAAKAHVGEYGLPASEEVLARLMALDDSSLALAAIEALAQHVAAGSLKRRQALKGRLRALIMMAESKKVLAAAKGLMTALDVA